MTNVPLGTRHAKRPRASAVPHACFPRTHPRFPDPVRRVRRRRDVPRSAPARSQLTPPMFGPQHNWLVPSPRSARGLPVRLVRGSLLPLAVGAFCLSCALLPQGASLATLPAVAAAPTAAKLEHTAETE